MPHRPSGPGPFSTWVFPMVRYIIAMAKNISGKNPVLARLFAVSSVLLLSPCLLSAGGVSYNDLVSAAGPSGEEIIPVPAASGPSLIDGTAGAELMDESKWPSLFGGVHKKIMKSALATLNTREFEIRRDALISGSYSESGHPTMSANGGDVKGIWFGTSRDFDGGVLKHYEQFDSSTAYRDIGIICHLTEDMAVPTHAANIPHGLFVHNDKFEGFDNGDEDNIAVPGGADGKQEPYAYYQLVQNETRRKLPSWKDPATGKQYWVEAPNALRMGQDNTTGPKGHYGGDNGDDIYSGDKGRSPDPEIHARQLSAAAFATVEVLKAASRELPPLVYNLYLGDRTLKVGETSKLTFGALDNNSHSLDCVISVYRDGALVGEMSRGRLALLDPKGWYAPFFSRKVETEWTGMADFKTLPPGTYELEVKLTDEDGNTTPEEVNHDVMRENNTRIAVTVK